MQRALIATGILLALAGFAWPWISKLPLGRLPGDIHIVRDGYSLHFPVVSCIVVSVLLSLILWLLRR
jgi:uncharacterized protein HemY